MNQPQRFGPYSVVREIARGGMGVVYEALDPAGQRVAVKTLLHERIEDPRRRKRFQIETEALARLRHPHVVPLLAAGDEQGVPWFSLEFVEGESLQERLRRGPLSVEETVRIGHQLAQALSYVHGCGVLHRDLKPDNVLLRGDQALLTDFGLARDADTQLSRVTNTGAFLGTPGYWPPEQARGQQALVGPRSDLYGLGAVLYACLTGRPPLTASTLADFYAKLATGAGPPSIRSQRPEVPEWLDALCARCLRLEPGLRPDSAEALARELILGARSRGRRAPSLALLAGAALLAAVSLAGAIAVALGRDAAATEPAADPAASEPAPEPLDELSAVLDATDTALDLVRGDALRESGELEPALEAYGTAIAKDPDDPRAYVGRAQTRLALGEPELAIGDYRRALELEDDPTTRLMLASTLAQSGQADAALVAFTAGIEADPDAALGYLGRGALFQRLERYEEARVDLERGLALDPNRPAAHSNLGVCRAALGDHAGAVASYSQALERGLKAARVYAERAESHLALGRLDEALADYDAAVELEPDSTRYRSWRGSAAYRAGDFERALADFSAVVAQRPSANAHCVQGLTLSELKRHREAVRAFERAQALDPKMTTAHLGRARAHVALGEHGDAVVHFSEALAQTPGDRRALTQRAASYRALKRYPEAIADSSAAIQLAPQDPSAYYARGLAYRAQGKSELGLADYERAIERAPKVAVYHYSRARALVTLKRKAEAAESYARAFELAPKQASYASARAELLQELGRYEGALEAWTAVVALEPRSAEAHGGRGEALLSLGRYPEALEAYAAAAELAPDVAAHANGAGVAHYGLKQNDAALAAYTRALELDPDYALAHRNRGHVLMRLERWEEAEADYDAAIRLEPSVRNHLARANLLEQRTQPFKALIDYNAVLKLEPNHVDSLVNRARLRSMMLQTKPALRDWNKVIALEPDEGLHYLERGLAQGGPGGDPRAAIADLERALELGLAPADAEHAERVLGLLRERVR